MLRLPYWRGFPSSRTREAIVGAGKDALRLGWSGAIMRGVAGQARRLGEDRRAPYRTKAELLNQAVDYAIAGDLRAIPILDHVP